MKLSRYVEEYQKLGWIVIPIVPNDKKPMVENWSHATKDDDTSVRDMFLPRSNIGIVMGRNSGIISIDVDVKNHDGLTTLAELEAQLGKLPFTVQSSTPSGGVHYYFQYEKSIINRKMVGKGIDIQGEGTQTLEAPSMVDGKHYRWINDPFHHKVAKLPSEWLTFLSSDTSMSQNQKSSNIIQLARLNRNRYEPPESIEKGSRNVEMTRYCASLIGQGKGKDEIQRLMEELNANNEPPLSTREVNTIIKSMLKKDSRKKEQEHLVAVKQAKTNDSEKVFDFDNINDVPWLEPTKKGYDINDGAFAIWYVERRKLYCIKKVFYTEHGELEDDLIKSHIQSIIMPFVSSRLDSKATDLMKAIKNHAYTKMPRPDKYTVHFNNMSLRIFNGYIEEVEPMVTLNKIYHDYDPAAKCPLWEKFLTELFYEDDIATVQQYLGYCLIPNTKLQRALFICGDAGTGKSRVSAMIHAIFGHNAIQGDLKKLAENQFTVATLEHRLLFYQDDMSMSAYEETALLKSLITADTPIQVERKGKDKYESMLYARLIGIGNGTPQFKHDLSDGMTRRLLPVIVRPLPPNRKPDNMLSEKMEAELDGIIAWCMRGLIDLSRNSYVMNISQRSLKAITESEEDNNNVKSFLRSGRIIITKDAADTVTSKEFYQEYRRYCDANGDHARSNITLNKYLRSDGEKLGIIYEKHLPGEVRGWRGVKIL